MQLSEALYQVPEQMLLIGCVLALVWGVMWALFLQLTRMGRFLAVKRTWITVVIGVGVDLAIALLVVPWAYWLPLLLIVAASSVGIIGRSLYNELRETDETLDVLKNSASQ